MKIAVIGAGISGLSAAWLLSQHHEVHLFEEKDRLGGHANTVNISEAKGSIPVDTGFLVYNELTYPNLTEFFKVLQVETATSDMSLSIKFVDKDLEWNGKNLNTVFGQRTHLFKPSFYRMLMEILRFGREAEDNLIQARRHAWTLMDLLKACKHSTDFMTSYLVPMGAAIWSTSAKKMFDFPAETFLTFCLNHKLLQVNDRPIWRTVKNGSIQYVQKVAAQLSHIHLKTPVLQVERISGRVEVKTAQGTAIFDRVVFATHAPITAKILKFNSDQEKSVLSTIQYAANHAVLHSDSHVMPRRKRCWASWNVLSSSDLNRDVKVSLSYYLNMLQPLPTHTDYFVTLNPKDELKTAIKHIEYSHPQLDRAAIQAQKNLPELQGQGGVYFAGAWSRYGFHEDGLLSAINVARRMDIFPPWSVS